MSAAPASHITTRTKLTGISKNPSKARPILQEVEGGALTLAFVARASLIAAWSAFIVLGALLTRSLFEVGSRVATPGLASEIQSESSYS